MDRSDVLIIGGGIAGITTALELLDGGKSVALLDRDEEGVFGGLARESFGGMFFVDSPEQRRQGIRDSVDLAYRDWCSFAEFGDDDRWPRAWAEAYVSRCTEDVYKFVRGHGVTFPARGQLGRARRIRARQFGAALSCQLGHRQGTGGSADCGLARPSQRRPPDACASTRGSKRSRCRAARSSVPPATTRRPARRSRCGRAVVVAAGGINGGDLSRVRANWHRDWKTPPETISQRLAPLCRRQAA